MINQSINTHLTRAEIIKSGSFYTGRELVDLVYNKLHKYITPDSIIADFGSGYGSFIEKFKDCGKRCFGTEFDDSSYQLLTSEYPSLTFYHENSLLNVSRDKYNIRAQDKLLIVGNPPYNDTTSLFKKGQKGDLICDNDLISRDFGISFLKAYNKIKANYVCVLHPLAYLIKKQNFNALGCFKDNYRLISGTVFSSKEFESIKKTNSDFPVVAALYERTVSGMTYEYIKKYRFSIFNSNCEFVLNNIETIDGIINKYPSNHRKNLSGYEINLFGENINELSILQFYTLRDMNALMRNAGFVDGVITNGIDVTIDNLYQYSWLFYIKTHFNPLKNKFLYGNLSPLYSSKLNDPEFRRIVVSFAYNNCNLVRKYISKETIEKKYGPLTDLYKPLETEMHKLNNLFT